MQNRASCREVRDTRRARAWALASTLIAIALTLIFPHTMGPLPSGMSVPIIAFELVRTRQEVETMFGSLDAQRAVWAALMEAGNLVDYLFMLAYGGFYVTFARALRPGGRRWTNVAVVLGVCAPLFDVAENVALLQIGGALGGSYDDALMRLQWFTWLKWFAICAVLLSWSPGLWRAGVLGRVVTVLSCASTLAAIVAFVLRGAWAEFMAHGVVLAVLLASALTLRTRVAHGRAAEPPDVPAPSASEPDEEVVEGAVRPVSLDGVLDLHTFRPRDVEDVVREYVRACHAANVRELRIIHGKGKGVQRDAVIRVLDGLPEVAAHRPAEPHRGGWGARIVDLHAARSDLTPPSGT